VRREIRWGAQIPPDSVEPVGIDDLVSGTQRRWIELRVEAVDLALQPVGIDESDGEHRSQLVDISARGIDHQQPIADRGECRQVGNRESQMVEPAAFEHRVGEPVGGWVVVRYLEHVEHRVAGHEDGLAAVGGLNRWKQLSWPGGR
jgi:hypothetical protein